MEFLQCSQDGYYMYRVILRIMKAGCHPVAIAQVVEHMHTLSTPPPFAPACAFSKCGLVHETTHVLGIRKRAIYKPLGEGHKVKANVYYCVLHPSRLYTFQWNAYFLFLSLCLIFCHYCLFRTLSKYLLWHVLCWSFNVSCALYSVCTLACSVFVTTVVGSQQQQLALSSHSQVPVVANN